VSQRMTIPLNDPPRLEPPPGVASVPDAPPTEAVVQSAIAQATAAPPPEIENITSLVTLPGGLVTTDGRATD
jgi:hypothetical protein